MHIGTVQLLGSVLLFSAASLLSACGDGIADAADGERAGQPPPQVRELLPVASYDTHSAGDASFMQSNNYIALQAGNHWTYRYKDHPRALPQSLTRYVSSGLGDEINLIESVSGESVTTRLRRGGPGWLAVQPMDGVFSETLSRIVGDLLEYPETVTSPNAKHTAFRQGPAGDDFDGDGFNDSFSLTVEHSFLGFESLQLTHGSYTDVARFNSYSVFTIIGSDENYEPLVAMQSEDTWWAAGIGMLRAERTQDGVTSTWELEQANVGDQLVYPQPVDGSIRKVLLAHYAAVFDATRNRYYATIPATNSIAIVDPVDASVTTVAAQAGLNPGPMALSGDASVLYVAYFGADGGGAEIVRFGLPQMTVQARLILPADIDGSVRFAQSLAVSPVDSQVLAVSLAGDGSLPQHRAVVLFRDTVLQLQMSEQKNGSNRIIFNDIGTDVFGYGGETGGFLRRYRVALDGLILEHETAIIERRVAGSFSWTSLGILVEESVYQSPKLQWSGTVPIPGGRCVQHPISERVVCLSRDPLAAPDPGAPRTLTVIDPGRLNVLSQPVYERGTQVLLPRQLLPGLAGQVGLRMGGPVDAQTAEQLWLFSSDHF
ncbi:MAG: hypothetical protein WBD13_16380 [Burkholderiaceae bacterium]